MPTRCVQAAGMRTDPAPSDPTAAGTMPAATAAALPPDDPPGEYPSDHGLRVTPKAGPDVNGHCPNSQVVALPTMTAPAARSRAASGPSPSWTLTSTAHPNRVSSPSVSVSSFTAIGTPSRGRRSPAASARSAASASDARRHPGPGGTHPRCPATHARGPVLPRRARSRWPDPPPVPRPGRPGRPPRPPLSVGRPRRPSPGADAVLGQGAWRHRPGRAHGSAAHWS
jgi:hypothetical protein